MKIAVEKFGFNVGEYNSVHDAMQAMYNEKNVGMNNEQARRWYSANNSNLCLRIVPTTEEEG